MSFYVVKLHVPFTLQRAENVSMSINLTAGFEIMHFEVRDHLMMTYKKSEVSTVGNI